MDMENDDQYRFECVLRRLSTEQLKAVATAVRVEQAQMEADADDKRSILRSIQAILDVDPTQLSHLMKVTIPGVPEDAGKQIMAILIGVPSPTESKVDRNQGDTASLLKALGIKDGNSTFRREFRIAGNIGTSPECLTYISLCSQVTEGRRKGYTNEEVMAAIKKAVSPSTKLRTLLDARTDMTLEEVLTFVRVLMKEKTATELYKDLSEAAQAEDEDTQLFLLRAMGLRERLVMAPEIEGIVRFDKSQIQDMFLHAVRTGLRDINVRTRLEEPLRRGMCDEKLLMEVNAAAAEEVERGKKRAVLPKTTATTAHTYAKQQTPTTEAETMMGMMKGLRDEVKSEMRSMRGEIADMRKNQNSPQKTVTFQASAQPFQPAAQPAAMPVRACTFCHQKGFTVCRHCYRCGAGDHMAQNCHSQSKSNMKPSNS